jgi:hypothetical protein
MSKKIEFSKNGWICEDALKEFPVAKPHEALQILENCHFADFTIIIGRKIPLERLSENARKTFGIGEFQEKPPCYKEFI